MRRIDTSTAVEDMFGPGKSGFRDGNKGSGTLATRLRAALFNAWQEELANVIESTGVTLDPDDNTQLLTAINKKINDVLGTPVGTVIIWPGATPPVDYIVVPTAATNLSRASFPLLHAWAASQGYPWGSGDGATTFGTYWLAADHTILQANGNVGTRTVGQNLAHSHGLPARQTAIGGSISGDLIAGGDSLVTNQSGGPANIAAGARILLCQKYR